MPIDSNSNLYYQAFGPENETSIVFLHGGGAGGWMWRNQVNALQSEFHCLTPDLPEQGQSRQAGAYTTEGAADHIAALIRSQAHGGRAHVVGLSEGAQVVVALLSRTPEVVSSAFISSAILRPMPFASLYTRGVFAWTYRWFLQPFKRNDWWIRLNMHYSAGIGDEFFPEFKQEFQNTTESGLVNLMTCALRFRLPDGLQQVQTPALVVVGSKEYAQMKESGRDLLKVLSRAQGVMVNLGPKSSLANEHNWAMSAPERFNETLRAWIKGETLPGWLLPLETELSGQKF